jgi:hypothetical protein
VALDLETFLTTLYVMTDELYVKYVRPHLLATGGPKPALSDSEVLCLGLAAQWRSGVPWRSERGFVRYALRYLRPFFPGMTSQSAFNRRLRRLWGAFILIQQALAEQLLAPTDCEIMDCVPVPIARGARSFHPGWLADMARNGKGGNEHYFYGLHLLLVVSAQGVATGWTLASGNVQDRWLAELLLSARQQRPQLTGPLGPRNPPRPLPPTDWLGPVQSCGRNTGRPVVADQGYDGQDWLAHWTLDYDAQVITKPAPESGLSTTWFSSLRQTIETAFAHLDESFALKFPGAHTCWGLLTRMAAKLAAYNLGIAVNRLYQRPDSAFATLIL